MNKKILIIIIVVLLVIIGGIIIIQNNNYNAIFNSSYTIPNDYKLKLENNLSDIDGPDTTYYIYNDKVITEEDSYFPLGQFPYTNKKTIILYSNIDTTNINTLNDIPKLENGVILYTEEH